MRACSLELDGEPILARGRVVKDSQLPAGAAALV
jgi:hypothetical protein